MHCDCPVQQFLCWPRSKSCSSRDLRVFYNSSCVPENANAAAALGGRELWV